MPAANSVIKVGACVGVLSTYINDRLALPGMQFSLDPNPYLLQSLEKAKFYSGIHHCVKSGGIRYAERHDIG